MRNLTEACLPIRVVHLSKNGCMMLQLEICITRTSRYILFLIISLLLSSLELSTRMHSSVLLFLATRTHISHSQFVEGITYKVVGPALTL